MGSKGWTNAVALCVALLLSAGPSVGSSSASEPLVREIVFLRPGANVDAGAPSIQEPLLNVASLP